jgi:hypothetical protein
LNLDPGTSAMAVDRLWLKRFVDIMCELWCAVSHEWFMRITPLAFLSAIARTSFDISTEVCGFADYLVLKLELQRRSRNC